MINVSKKLKTYSIFHRWRTAVLLFSYFFFRFLSFLVFKEPLIQGALAVTVFLIFCVLYFKNPKWSWYMLLGELLLAGSGHFITFADISIRSILIISFLLLSSLHQLGDQYFYTKSRIGSSALVGLVLVLFTVGVSLLVGLINGHGILAIRDATPFVYLLLFFPAYYIFRTTEDVEELIRFIIIFILGSAIFSLFTFFLFSSGLVELQEPFYKWFRDVNMGKITNMGGGFFRIVEPSHLLITPLILIISSLLMKDEKHHHMWRVLLFASLVVFVLNLSRSYMLALVGGFVILIYKHTWKRWFKITGAVLAQILIIFIFINLMASGGSSIGLNMGNTRINSITNPKTEKSAHTRLSLLSPIKNKILENPILGSGLGATVTFTPPNTFKQITTQEFDWGYLEMLVEFGVVGTAILLGVLFFLIVSLIKRIHHFPDYQDLHVGLLAGLFALGIINITAPALIHVYGILYIVMVSVITLKTPNVFEEMIIIIYRTFHAKGDLS